MSIAIEETARKMAGRETSGTVARASRDNLTVEKVGFWPREVEPGERVRLEVRASASAGGFLGTFVGDADFCTPSAVLNDGIRVDLRALSGRTELDRTVRCIADGVEHAQTWTFAFNAPQSGTFDITVEAVGAQSGNFLGSVSQSISVVSETGDTEPTPTNGDGDASPVGRLEQIIGDVGPVTFLLLGGFGALLLPVAAAIIL